MSRRSNDSCRIYVGGLPNDVRSREVEELFEPFGKITYVDLKNNKRGPPYAFIEFEDPRDANDAVQERDGYRFDGAEIRVEFPRRDGPGPGRSFGGGGGYGGHDGGRGGRGFGGRGGRSGPPSRRSDYRLLVKGLPPTGSWQDLKDHMRQIGEVCYAEVYKDGTGVVEFVHFADMRKAVHDLDDSKFRSHENETRYIRVKEDSHEASSSRRARSSRSRSFTPPKRSRASPRYSPYP